MEDKQAICDQLAETLKLTRGGDSIEKIDFKKNNNAEFVLVRYRSGFTRPIDVTGDSGTALITDVMAKI